MKKIRILVAAVFLLLTFGLTPVFAIGNKKTPVEPTMTPAELQVLIDRLEEIKEIDKSLLTKSEKKELRTELRNTKEEIKRNSGGIYLSVGALLLVIILLIILL
jgi:hypothetical protein